MPRDHRLYLDDILQAVERIREYTASMGYDDFVIDHKTQDAVIHNLEIIDEAVTRLPESATDKAPEVEWRKIVGMRNLLVHEYFGISLPVVWDVVQNKVAEVEYTATKLLLNFEDTTQG